MPIPTRFQLQEALAPDLFIGPDLVFRLFRTFLCCCCSCHCISIYSKNNTTHDGGGGNASTTHSPKLLRLHLTSLHYQSRRIVEIHTTACSHNQPSHAIRHQHLAGRAARLQGFRNRCVLAPHEVPRPRLPQDAPNHRSHMDTDAHREARQSVFLSNLFNHIQHVDGKPRHRLGLSRQPGVSSSSGFGGAGTCRRICMDIRLRGVRLLWQYIHAATTQMGRGWCGHNIRVCIRWWLCHARRSLGRHAASITQCMSHGPIIIGGTIAQSWYLRSCSWENSSRGILCETAEPIDRRRVV